MPADTAPATVAPSLRRVKGTVEVSVALSRKAVAAGVATNATRTGALPTTAAQRTTTRAVRSQQTEVGRRAGALGARITGRATRAANVVTLKIAAGRIDDLARIPGVVSVKPVTRYSTTAATAASGSLAQAAQYLGADRVRARGVTGKGVRVAVLDSGIDYTHRNFGGPGTKAAYDACFAAATEAVTGACARLFGPSAPRVKGGFDFVGERWPGTTDAPVSEEPDPNPIDFEGHGTHVADIIGGRSADGKHLGIAPGVDLYAVKVCSSVATSCSGPALLQAVDWALDPNGDGAITDAVDIMNLSLGSDYAQVEDDLTAAVENAVHSGVMAVISAGNGGDRPFIVGSPSTAPSAVSVAQTALPDDRIYPITVNSPTIPGLPGNVVKYSVAQPWAPLPTAPVTGALAVPKDPLGCTAAGFADFPRGAIALIRRGTCAASLKAQLAQAAGASAVIIYNNVPGDPPTFSFAGGDPVTVPTFTISLQRGQQLAAAIAAGPVTVTIDPKNSLPLTNTTVGTSSRGPATLGSVVKPDLGAPGAWDSAEVGTGSEETAFGGTSGAAPTVTGVAALVLQAHPKASPLEVKARLLNTASLDNRTLDADANRYATPVTRVGAGEVRAYPAVFGTSLLENRAQANGNIGLGQPHLTTRLTRVASLRLTNTSAARRTYLLSTTLRDPADANLGAVSATVAPRVVVPARGAVTVQVTIGIDPSKLPRWPFTRSAGATGNGAELNGPEIDGYVIARSRLDTVHLGWHVLPHRSADVTATPKTVRLADGTAQVTLRNRSSVLEGGVDVFGLTGTSGTLPTPAPGTPGTPGSNQAVIDLAAIGVRDDVKAGTLEFAVADRARHAIPLYPAGHEVDLDVDRDGTTDYAVYQSQNGTTGTSVVFVQKIGGPAAQAYYYTEADFDSSTRVFTVPLEAVGLKAGASFDFSVTAYDNYLTGIASDEITGMSWTVGSPRYTATNGASFSVPAGGSTKLGIVRNADAGPSSQTGLLLRYLDARTTDAEVITVG